MNDPYLPQNRKWSFFIAALLLIAVAAVYYQVGAHAFVNFDDPEYVYANPFVQKGLSLENVRWAFTTTHAANWHPITWLCHMLVVQFFGLNPAAHHFANVLLHAANAVLLFFLFNMLTGKLWQSAAVAALFAFHPLHVESVAWVAELKDVSSTFFGLLAMLLYLWFIKQPGLLRYFSALMCFSLGLISSIFRMPSSAIHSWQMGTTTWGLLMGKLSSSFPRRQCSSRKTRTELEQMTRQALERALQEKTTGKIEAL